MSYYNDDEQEPTNEELGIEPAHPLVTLTVWFGCAALSIGFWYTVAALVFG